MCIEIDKHLPRIFASKGNAELKINTRVQFPIIKLKGVQCALGLILYIGGDEYNPIEDVTIRYRMRIISNAAPNGPSIDNELIPNVNCYETIMPMKSTANQLTVRIRKL